MLVLETSVLGRAGSNPALGTMKTEKILMEHTEGLTGSEYNMKVVLVPGQFSGWDIKCLCSNSKTENGDDIWFETSETEAKTMLEWAILELAKQLKIIK